MQPDVAMGGRPGDRSARSASPETGFYLILMALVWAGNFYGFGGESIRRLRDGPDFPPVVHLHAFAFVGWLAVVTLQIVLARRRDRALHRRIGSAAMGLAASMILLGSATAFLVDAQAVRRPGFPPAFFFLQIGDLLLFGMLVSWAYAKRRVPAVHGRLMLLATVNLSTAGFGRFMPGLVAPLVGSSFPGRFLTGNLAVVVLVVTMIGFDAVRQVGPWRMWAVALPLVLAVQVAQTWVVGSPAANAAAHALLAAGA